MFDFLRASQTLFPCHDVPDFNFLLALCGASSSTVRFHPLGLRLTLPVSNLYAKARSEVFTEVFSVAHKNAAQNALPFLMNKDVLPTSACCIHLLSPILPRTMKIASYWQS